MAYATRTVSSQGAESQLGGIATGLLVSATTPAAEYIECGFKPSRIELVNYNGTNPITWIWTKGMTVGAAYKIDGSATTAADTTKVSGGPEPWAGGSATVDGVAGVITQAGFMVPAALQTNGHTWSWTAWR